MLSSISKLADRTFILGAFLPTLLFSLCLLFEFHDKEFATSTLDALTEKDLGKAVYLLLIVWAMAVMLTMFNYNIYRFFEGYTFPSPLARWCKSRQVCHYLNLKKELSESIDQSTYNSLSIKVFSRFPTRKEEILPTRFGNSIKAFEVYPRDIYGVDAIKSWPRLVTVIPQSFKEEINSSRTQVDFMINLSVLSFILSLTSICRLLMVDGVHDWVDGVQNSFMLWAIAAGIASYLFYRWSLVGVSHWGELVKSAFDCYLPKLASQLGFELPETEEKRRRFWTTFSQQITYGRNEDGKPPFKVEEWIKAQLIDVEDKDLKQGNATDSEKEEEREEDKSDGDDDD